MRLDEFEFIDDVFWRAHPKNVAVQRLRDDAVAATVRAAAPGKNHHDRVEVRPVKVALVAGEKMLVVCLAHPGNFVEVSDFRTFGLEVDFSARCAVGKTRDIRNVRNFATEMPHQIACRVVRFADDDVIEIRFVLHRFERFRGGVRSHDGRGDIEENLERLDDGKVVDDARRARACDDEFRSKGANLCNGRFEVKVHRRTVYQLHFVTIRFDGPRRIAQKHRPIECTRLGDAGTAGFPAEHGEIRRI